MVVLLLATGLDILITKGLRHRTDYVQEIWNDVMDTTVTPDVLVFGSCAAQYDCNPYLLDSVLGCDSYVLSMSNLTFPCHNFMWQMYKKYNPNHLPKTIVLMLDYGDMDYREVKGSQEEKQFISLTLDPIAREFLTTYGGYSKAEIYCPCYRYFGSHDLIRYGILNGLGMKKYKGQHQHYKGFVPLYQDYEFHAEWYGKENTVPMQPDVQKMFEDMLAECQERGIQVLVSIAPLGHELEDIIANKDEIYGYYKEQAEKYDFPYISYSENEFSHNIGNFESPNHLNGTAADVFTLQMAHDIKELGLYK